MSEQQVLVDIAALRLLADKHPGTPESRVFTRAADEIERLRADLEHKDRYYQQHVDDAERLRGIVAGQLESIQNLGTAPHCPTCACAADQPPAVMPSEMAAEVLEAIRDGRITFPPTIIKGPGRVTVEEAMQPFGAAHQPPAVRDPILWEKRSVDELLAQLDEGELDDRACAYAAALIRDAHQPDAALDLTHLTDDECEHVADLMERQDWQGIHRDDVRLWAKAFDDLRHMRATAPTLEGQHPAELHEEVRDSEPERPK